VCMVVVVYERQGEHVLKWHIIVAPCASAVVYPCLLDGENLALNQQKERLVAA
jgi:hypothetical protein